MNRIAIPILLLMTGCATPVSKYSISSDLEPYSFYYKGTPHLGSGGKNARVYLGPASPAQNAGSRHLFLVEIKNLGKKPISVAPEDFDVTTNEGKELHVLSAQELQREANKKAAWMEFSAGLQAASNSLAAANAGHTDTYGNYSSRTTYSGYGGYTKANTNGSFSASTYDSGAAARAQIAANSENRQLFAEYDAKIDSIIANAQSGAFQRQTIYPGQSILSPLLITKIPKKTQRLDIKLTVADEIHKFYWIHSVE